VIAAGALCFAVGHATAKGTQLSDQTRTNLDQAMHGEAFAYAKYQLFAKQARQEGHPEIAKIFEEAAQQERFQHFAEEGELAGTVGDTASNLQDAIKGESYEVRTMYPQFARQARAAGDTAAADRFEEISRDEQKHRDRFQAALDQLQGKGRGVGGAGGAGDHGG
jgi:rubrerythrin